MSAPFLHIAFGNALADPIEGAASICAWMPDEDERATVAATILGTLSPAMAELIAQDTLDHLRQGPPVAPFWNLKEEAATWAELASPAEIAVYAWVAFHALTLDRRTRFLAKAYSEAEAPS
ncbi:MAG: hypothetical protein AAGK00_18225 [Pseudomonadota bacterium]